MTDREGIRWLPIEASGGGERVGMREPDFGRLGRETLWSSDAWRHAWDTLESTGGHREALWRNVLAFVRTGAYGPRDAALMLTKALHDPIHTAPAHPQEPTDMALEEA